MTSQSNSGSIDWHPARLGSESSTSSNVLVAFLVLLIVLVTAFTSLLLSNCFRRPSILMKASIWRGLMAVGMKFHHYAQPKPPRPSFKLFIPSRLAAKHGTFKLVFYVPDSYYSDFTPDEYRFPFVVNFHGGGFTLGTGTDDARWASAVTRHTEAVLVSVEYRLAPEHPFSVGVEDCTDALIYLAAHAEELRLDPNLIALSGFSAGGNFALTVPLILHDLRQGKGKRSLDCNRLSAKAPQESRRVNSTRSLHTMYSCGPKTLSRYQSTQSQHPTQSPYSSTLSVPLPRSATIRTQSSSNSILRLTDLEPTVLETEQKVPDLTICCLVSFYPPTDFRINRSDKRATNPCPEKNLPSILTNLFDQAYIQSAQSVVDLTDPYLSPAAADDDFLLAAYPDDIILYTCEYDMLNAEGRAFGERLESPPIGKNVHGGLVKASVHAFDKKPNPLSFPMSADRCYSEACAELKRLFGGRSTLQDRGQLSLSNDVKRFEGRSIAGPLVHGSGTINQGHSETRTAVNSLSK